MNKSIIVAIFFTIVLLITYISAAIYILKVINFPFWGFSVVDCTLEMAFSNKKCMCVDLKDPKKCKWTGQNWVDTQAECKPCPPIKFPVGYYIISSIFGIVLILTILAWINVFTKTVKF